VLNAGAFGFFFVSLLKLLSRVARITDPQNNVQCPITMIENLRHPMSRSKGSERLVENSACPA
jgi:hypothetical protein